MGDALLNESRIRPLLYSIVVLTLVMNVGVTSLIVWRIWRVRRKTMKSSVHPNRLKHVTRIIVDSGLMYTVTVIIFFGTTLAENNAQYGVSDVAVQVIVSTSCFLLIRRSRAHQACFHLCTGHRLQPHHHPRQQRHGLGWHLLLLHDRHSRFPYRRHDALLPDALHQHEHYATDDFHRAHGGRGGR